MNARAQQRYEQRQALIQRVDAYKAARGCRFCGERDVTVLDLHHRPEYAKIDTIANMINKLRPLDQIEAEIAKCDVICANDHRRVHAGLLIIQESSNGRIPAFEADDEGSIPSS